MVKEEFQATREELCTKAAALDRARREAYEAESLGGALGRGVQYVTRGPLEAGGYDQPKGWSNSGVEGRGLHFMGLRMARFSTQGCQGFFRSGLQYSSS